MTRKGELKKWIESKKGKWYLVNLENKTYDPKPFNNFDDAVKINLMLQLAGRGDMIVPLQIDIIKRDKFRKAKMI